MDPVSEIDGLSRLWKLVNGGDPGIRIAIIDGPVDLDHPSLTGARLILDEAAAHTKAKIKSEHGTHVTSVLMGTPGSSVFGVAPNCTATIYSIYDEGDNGELISSSQARLALTINRALADGADVINISSGQLTPTGKAERILADAVRACKRARKLIVAAAGNDGCRCLQVPASLESVLAVGACDLDGWPLPFSNFGDAYLENGILAPGKDVTGASPSQSVALRSGTSFATPVVTGVIALFLSLQRSTGNQPDIAAVKETLLTTATRCRTSDEPADRQRCLKGILNIPDALMALFGNAVAAAEHSHAHQFVSNTPAVVSGRALQINMRNGGERVMADIDPRSMDPSSGIAVAEANPAMHGTLRPAEATSAPAAAIAEGAASSAAHGAAPPPVASSAQATAMPNTMWVPVSMAGSIMPSGFQPAHPGFMMPYVTPSGLMPSETSRAAAPNADTRTTIRTNDAGCGCGVRPAQAQATQVAYLDPVLTTSLHGPAGTHQMAFPLGQVYFDFGKEARVDYFVQAIASWRDSLVGRGNQDFGPNRDRAGDSAAPYNPEIMARYFLDLAPGEQTSPSPVDVNFRDADALIWTLTIDTTPIYAIKPLDVFGLGFYSSLVQALWYQEVSASPPSKVASLTRASDAPTQTADGFPPKGRITRVSFAGWLDPTATTRLLNGTVLPTLVTDWRGFYQWDLYTLLGNDPEDWPDGAADFLDRIYNEFRNTGVSPQDRALNYSAMNALNTKQIFGIEAAAKRRLDTVEVDKSTICRPDSDCYDVTFRFFDPLNVLTQARQVYQYTIDVSDVVPVPVGRVRKWAVY